ncbi:hypothetical protein BDV93DRAFT_331713 [Ceratobasidium sp. AG-I]|nr:hypothetical protein BDV93DRAFT_331713 [Ceratobasidium sp. AG-I]
MESNDLSLSTACRILVVSGDVAQSKELVSRIKSFASTPLTSHPNDESYIEWTIKNKYYTAPVHLYLHQIAKPPAKPLWPPETDDERVPALIFVFRKGKPYQDTFLSMREAYLAHDAEVALAVAIPPDSSDVTPSFESPDSIEEFFSGHNFEYVDVEDTPDESEHAEHPQYDIRGLPRIFEALNMIMWPSMVRTPHGGLRRNIIEPDSLNDSDPDAFEHSFATISDTAPPDHPSLFDIHNELSSQSLEELDAWLDSEGSWVGPINGSILPAPRGTPHDARLVTDGFEDDFTDFLSVPPAETPGADLPSPFDVQATTKRIFGQQNLEEDAPGGFDLTSVLGTLEAMREEISTITDLEERRIAAARVALSLAMGLGLDNDSDEEGNKPEEEILRELQQLREPA